ncbi:MAG: ion transporter [Myxococcales bacterium]|jgi:voltage-gated sodium channel|nr:ion transporter [Myxococcales bacterium]
MPNFFDSRLTRALISEKTVLVAICLNALALFVLAQSDPDTLAMNAALGVDYACVLFFLGEAIIKLGRSGWRYFESNWNRFDFSVVLFSLPVLLSPWFDLHEFAVVLLLRLGRLFRLFQLFRFIPNVERMMVGVRRSLRASVGVVIALLILLFILALGANMLFGHFAPEHFGTPFISLYSVFRVFTIEGWYEMPEAIAANATDPLWGMIARLYFMVTVLGGGILGLSLANAIFVDEMTMDNNDDLTAKIVELQHEIAELKMLLLQRQPQARDSTVDLGTAEESGRCAAGSE